MRHEICASTFSNLPDEIRAELTRAEKHEAVGNWYRAGEIYLRVANKLKPDAARFLDGVIAYSRAAACFEFSSQSRDAARAYLEAASLLDRHETEHQICGELYNRAAFNLRMVEEFFHAGSSYRNAANAFSKAPAPNVHTQDNIPPVPTAAGKYTVAARCFEASSDAFLQANDIAWASGSSWLASAMYAKQGTSSATYDAMRRALVLTIRFYQTLEPEAVRSALPMTDEEREKKVNPVEMLEKAIADSNHRHYEMNKGHYPKNWNKLETSRQMISAYHEFYLELMKIGNIREARKMYVLEKKRRKTRYGEERRFGSALLYWLWEITCGYGESLGRWVLTSIVVLLFFTLIYKTFGLIEPVTSWIDYLYFSAVTITTLGYGDIHPIGILGKVMACFEVTCGLLIFGMLLTYINRRIFEV